MSPALRYRTEAFLPAAGWLRWWPLAAQEFGMLFRSRWGIALFFLCLIPAVGRLVMLLILFGVVSFGPGLRTRLQNRAGPEFAQFDPARVEFYVEPLLATMPGMVFALLLTAFVVSRAIARDRATNALELYWTRGIGGGSYFFAKWLGSTGLVGLVTVAAPLSQWLIAVFLAEDWSFFVSSAPAVLPGVLALAAMTGVLTAICVLLSAIAGSPNGATVAWCLLVVGSSAVGAVLAQVLREPWLQSCLSLWDALGVLVRELAGIDTGGEDVSALGALSLVGSLFAVLALLARRRLGTAEAVA